jgi:hypothetical protein
MVWLLARVIGVGLETADMLVHEILSRNLRDQRAVASYAPHWRAGRERQEKPGERFGQSRERQGATRDDPACIALPPVPKRQRVGPMVSGGH